MAKASAFPKDGSEFIPAGADCKDGPYLVSLFQLLGYILCNHSQVLAMIALAESTLRVRDDVGVLAAALPASDGSCHVDERIDSP